MITLFKKISCPDNVADAVVKTKWHKIAEVTPLYKYQPGQKKSGNCREVTIAHNVKTVKQSLETVTVGIFPRLYLAKIRTMAKPKLPDSLPKHTQKEKAACRQAK